MSLLRTLATAPLALSLLACTTDEPLGEWTQVTTVPGATMEPMTRDASGVDPLLVFPIVEAAERAIVSLDVTTGALRRDAFVATWLDEHRGVVTYFADELPEYRSVTVDVGNKTYVFGAHQGTDGRGAAIVYATGPGAPAVIAPLPDAPEAMPRPTGAGVIGDRPFAAGDTGLHAYDPRSNDWSSVDLPEGGPWSTTSVDGVAYAVGDTAAGVAILRLDVE